MPSASAIRLRDYRPSDLDAVVALFKAAVHRLSAAQYDAAQRQAWAPEEADRQAWQARLADLQVRVAEHRGRLAGFIGFTANGHIDLLFSSPQHARQGVATALYLEAEGRLKAAGISSIFTEASLTVRPFFERQGFSVEQAQTVVRGAVTLPRLAMRKPLRRPEH
ncbi:GNAT family N-acetyltransferase [Pseudomonas sp. sp1636]|uniref:GNAT family N-acetyltransferase n=1 Tax=Pseudomonas sp. sp1636 TaxID=3036707 RepID=UPI0025A548C3|nr:GNAT family N-acetyltransferase [Pseudomonas sp. sp1636]MDM8350662.1 GNAT family N-acetyltransferase [Pseudomonas sp. sp1636]